jgi:hypothetical protein
MPPMVLFASVEMLTCSEDFAASQKVYLYGPRRYESPQELTASKLKIKSTQRVHDDVHHTGPTLGHQSATGVFIEVAH